METNIPADDEDAPELKVLIADDDPIFRQVAASKLAQQGIVVTLARDGADALDALTDNLFDAVLVDLSMPRIDGFRLIPMIRGFKKYRDAPIIVVSSREDGSAIEEAGRLGANDYFTKPIDWETLAERVRQHCRRHAA